MHRVLLLPLILLTAGALAGHFIWPRQRGIPNDEKARVNAAWSAVARDSGTTEAALAQRPANPALAKTWDFLQRLEKTPVAEFPALWEELEKQGKEDQGAYYSHSSEELLLAERWAELDPEAAFAFFGGKPDSAKLVAAVFRTWARMNVETALAAVTAEKEDGRRAAALAGIFNAAAENPADLIAWGRRLSFLDASKLRPSDFDRVMPPDALRRAFESDPAGVRELAAQGPPWFRARLDAMTAARELATDLPAALARMDVAGLTKTTATAFVLDMLPLMEMHPDKLPAVIEHLTAQLGPGWLNHSGIQDVFSLFTSLAKSAPDKVHLLLSKAAADSPIMASNQADAALDLFATDPRLALQLAPAGDTWIGEFMGGALLLAGCGGPPQEALELVRTAPSSSMRNGLLHEALTALMKSSPDVARDWVDALPPGELQDTARVTLDLEFLSPEQAELERAAVSAAHGGENAASLDLVRQATRRLLRSDPEVAAAQIRAWPISPARDTALEIAGQDWADASTPDALTWAESLPDDAQPRALAGIMQTWAAAEPAAASEYLDALPPGPSRDAPVRGFARGLSEVDPATSLQWAATIQDAALRKDLLLDIAAPWMLKDPGTAPQAIAAIPGLTNEDRRTLEGLPIHRSE